MIPLKKIDVGIVTNLPTTSVVWSLGRNVRFKPGAVYKTLGKSLLTTVPGSLPVRGMFTFKGYDGVFRTIVCCDSKVFSYTNTFTSYSDITPASPPTGGSANIWRFSLIGGMPILTNGKDAIWKWSNFGSNLAVLSNAPVYAKALTTFMNRVILGNLQEGAYASPSRMGWSGIAEPEFWTENFTGKSGRKDLAPHFTGTSGADQVQDFAVRGRQLIIYGEHNVWVADNAAHPATFSFDIEVPDKGLLSPRLASLGGGVNYFMSQDDIIPLHPDLGPIGFALRNSIFPNLNKSALSTAFSFYKPSTREFFFCVPTALNATPDTAYVYQTETKAWSICDCDYLCHAFAFDETGYTWDTAPYGSWDAAMDSDWDSMSKTGIVPFEVVGDSQGRIFKMDSTNNNNGAAISGFIETGDFSGERSTIRKALSEVWPSFKRQSTRTHVMVQVGYRDSIHQDVRWSLPEPVEVGVDDKVNFRTSGMYFRLRFYTDQKDSPWIMDGVQYELQNKSAR